MTLFTKKPVTVEASQWFKNGDHPQDHKPFETNGRTSTETDCLRYSDYLQTEGRVVRRYRHPDVSGNKICEQCGNPHHVHGWVDMLEQGHRVCPGDWIITGINGERYPCKPDVFEATYTPAQAEPAPAPVGEYPALPAWAWRDDFGGLVPSEIRTALRAYLDADRAQRPAREVRLLTSKDIDDVRETLWRNTQVNLSDLHAEDAAKAFQRKFCEVNGLTVKDQS